MTTMRTTKQKSRSRALSKHIHRLPFYFLVFLLSSETFSFVGEKFLVNKSAILSLFAFCRRCHGPDTTVQEIVQGTFLRIKQVCNDCNYTYNWDSQPFIDSIPSGNLHLTSAIICSGSLPTKSLRLLKFMNCATISQQTFFRHQSKLLQPAISRVWERERTSNLEQLKSTEGSIKVIGDGRADSPGHSAKFGT